MINLLTVLILSQGLPIKSGGDTNLATVNSESSLYVVRGESTRATYTCVGTGLATTATYSMQLDAEASLGYKLLRVCVSSSNATAAAAVTVSIQRRTTASTGGTTASAEATTSPAVSKHNPSSNNWGGRCAVTPTLGTGGAYLDGWGQFIGELGAGAADPPGVVTVCRSYGENSDQAIRVAAGTTNGVSVSVGSSGAGGLAMGAISMMFVSDP